MHTKNKTVLCLLILFVSFSFDYGVTARPNLSNNEDPKELESKQSVINQEKKHIEDKLEIQLTLDAKNQNKERLAPETREILMKDLITHSESQFLPMRRRSRHHYMSPCHFKICNMGR